MQVKFRAKIAAKVFGSSIIIFILQIALMNALAGVTVNELNTTLYSDDAVFADLPISTAVKQDQPQIRFTAKLRPGVVGSVNQPALFIPYYDGNLLITMGGNIVFDSLRKGARQNFAVSRLSSAVIPVSPDWSIQEVEVSLSVDRDLDIRHGTFQTLSKVYYGEQQHFEDIVYRQRIYHEVFRPALCFALLLALAFICILSLSGIAGREVVPPIFLIMFIFLMNVGSLDFIFPTISTYHAYVPLLAPLALWALSKHVDTNISTSPRSYFDISFYVALSISIISFALNILQPVAFSIAAYNTTLTVPFILICLFLTCMKIVICSKSQITTHRMVLGVISGNWLLTLGYDLLGRLAFLEITAPLTGLNSLGMFIAVGSSFISQLVLAQRQLEGANLNLNRQLDIQKNRLNKYFLDTIATKERLAVAHEQSRINADLHDGVMSYLMSIMMLSEQRNEPIFDRIRTLVKFSLTELRVILSSRSCEKLPLNVVLATFRHTVVDTLVFSGIDVHWDTKALLKAPETDFSFNLEILRVVQEAVHNAIERAESKHLSVVAEYSLDGGFIFSIINRNGRGLNCGNPHRNGIQNMESRICRLGGTFEINGTADGAELYFTVGLPGIVRQKPLEAGRTPR